MTRNLPKFLKVRTYRDQFIFWVSCLSCISILGLAFFGANQHLEGWIEPKMSGEEFAAEHVYSAELQTKHQIWRGNGLFWVVDAKIDPSTEYLVHQHWFSDSSRGMVSLISSTKLKPDQRLKVNYRLQVRWKRLIPIIGATFLLACWMILQDQSKQILSNLLAGPITILFYMTVLFYIAIILIPIGWIPGDSHFLIASVVQGKSLPWTVFPEGGRFFPLGLFDLNLMLPFGDAPLAYQIERAILFMVLIGLLYKYSLKRNGRLLAGIIMLFFLTTPELLRTYSDVIFAESPLCLLLTCFFISFDRVMRGDRVVMVTTACLTALIATYCKEPIFGLFVVFAIAMLCFQFNQLNNLSLIVLCFLLVNAVIFLVIYGYICQFESRYLELRLGEERVSRWVVLNEVLKKPTILAFFLLAVMRLGQRLMGQKTKRSFEDAVLFAGVAYVLAFVCLGLSEAYYFLPAYTSWVIAVVGYLKPHDSVRGCNGSSPGSKPIPARLDKAEWNRVQRWAIGVLVLLTFLQIPSLINGAEFVISMRSKARLQAFVIRNLVESGFQIYLFTPVDLPKQLLEIQKWRQTIINVTDANSRKQTDFSLENLTFPAILISENELPIIDHPFVLWHDPKSLIVDVYPQLIDNGTGSALVPLDDRLELFGARAYTRIHHLETVQSFVLRFEQNRYKKSNWSLFRRGH